MRVTAPHQRLLTKLKGLGLGVVFMKWIGSFLSNRLTRVMANGQYSSWTVVVSGVPQGSVLGPLLFLLFVNDIPDWIKTNIRMFADDTKIWTKLSCPEDAVKIQEDLDMLSDWSAAWLLKFNPLKCKLMHLRHNMDTRYHITQDNQKWDFQSVHLEKDLGVFTSSDLAVSHQCMEAASKAWRVLGMVRRQFKELDAQSFLIIRPHLEYAIQAWSPYLRRDIDCLEKVQRRATKMVKGFYKLPYETRLKRLKLTSPEKRRQRGDLIEAYKILTSKEGVDPHCFFTLDQNRYGTRGHELKLYTRRSRLELRRNFFSQRVVPHWNRLPESVVMAESVNIFKNRLDRCEEWGN